MHSFSLLSFSSSFCAPGFLPAPLDVPFSQLPGNVLISPPVVHAVFGHSTNNNEKQYIFHSLACCLCTAHPTKVYFILLHDTLSPTSENKLSMLALANFKFLISSLTVLPYSLSIQTAFWGPDTFP